MTGQLLVLLITISVGALVDACIAQPYEGVDQGDGTIYRLAVVEDVWVESTRNYNNYQRLVVSKLYQFPIKRTLIRFQNLSSNCSVVNHAMMYLYYWSSGRASWHTPDEAPWITRTIEAHRVLKQWKETEATTTQRYSGALWSTPYLGLDDTDANDCPTGQTTIYALRPPGFVEIEVTSAVRDWKAGKSNYGLMLRATNEDQDGRDTRFYDRTHEDSSKHPYILVNCD